MAELKQLIFLIILCSILSLSGNISCGFDNPANYIDNINNLLIIGIHTSKDLKENLYCSIILTIDPISKNLRLTSLCKDTLINIPKLGNTNLSTAYLYGKELLLIKTIENNFNIKIDNYVVINEIALSKIIDSINGINFKNLNINGQQTINLLYKFAKKDIFLKEELQREILQEILYSFSRLSFLDYPNVIYHTFPHVKLNLTPYKMLNLGFTALSFNNYTARQFQFPLLKYSNYTKLNDNIYLNWDKNINLHKLNFFIYNK